MLSGLSPRWNARSTNSKSTRLCPTRKTPAGSSRSGTTIERGSKSTVVMVLLTPRANAVQLYHAWRKLSLHRSQRFNERLPRIALQPLGRQRVEILQPRAQAAAVGHLDVQARPSIGLQHHRAERGVHHEIDADVAQLQPVGQLHRGAEQIA